MRHGRSWCWFRGADYDSKLLIATHLHAQAVRGFITNHPDPIVEEVRKARGQYAAQFDYDVRAMCEDLRRRSARRGARTVNLPPRPVEPAPAPEKQAS